MEIIYQFYIYGNMDEHHMLTLEVLHRYLYGAVSDLKLKISI